MSTGPTRNSHHGQARHRVGRSPSRQEKVAERGLGHGQGLRRRGRPARRDPQGDGSRTTGRVKALARCDSIVRRAFPSLSSDIRRAAPIHGEKAGLDGADGTPFGYGPTFNCAAISCAARIPDRYAPWQVSGTLLCGFVTNWNAPAKLIRLSWPDE